MSGCLSQNFYNMNMKTNIVNNEEHHSPNLLEKQSIVSIKRTFSADMSSEKWLENNEFSLKRVKSSEHLQSLGEENDQNNGEIVNENKDGSGGAAFEDIWSSILAQKKPDGAVGAVSSDTALAPYVHPLVRRASSLSEKSLEICTESLGSETGSDGFSSPLSDHGEEQEKEVREEVEETKNDDVVHVEEVKGFVEVVKYNFPVNNKKVSVGVPRSFPPPLPSLAHRDDGSNLLMRTHRRDGRLVLEAVSVPSKNCLQARRQGGRLLLTLTDEVDDEEKEQDEDENDEEEEKGAAFKVDETLALPQTTRVIDVTRKSSSAVTMTKLMELVSTRNMSIWPRMSNMTIVRSLNSNEEVEEDEKKKLVEVEPARLKAVGKSLLPPRPRVNTTTAADTVLNAYEYYWRHSDSQTTAAVAVLKPLAGKQNNFSDSVSPQVGNDGTKGMKMFLLENNGKRVPQEEIVLFGGGEAGEKAENLVPLFRGCKDRRKSFFFFKPYCVATS